MSLVKNFVLKWNNFNNVLSYNFYDYLQTQKYCDVTLSVEGKFIHAHKMVLASSSKYFEQMFDLSNERQIIILSDMYFDDLTNIIEFAYKGEVIVSSESFERFMKTAKTLQMKGIVNEDSAEIAPPTPPSSSYDNSALEPFATLDVPVIKPEQLSDNIGNNNEEEEAMTLPKKRTRKRRADELDSSNQASTPVKAKVKTEKSVKSVVKVAKEESFPASNTIVCHFCTNFYSKKTIKGHEKYCKSNPDRSIHQCPICMKELSRLDKLNIHIKNHSKISSAKPKRNSV